MMKIDEKGVKQIKKLIIIFRLLAVQKVKKIIKKNKKI